MIPYAQSVASQEVPPPYYFPNVKAYAFVWEAEMNKVSEYCDTFFNLGTTKTRGFVYGPRPDLALRGHAVHRLSGDDQR